MHSHMNVKLKKKDEEFVGELNDYSLLAKRLQLVTCRSLIT